MNVKEMIPEVIRRHPGSGLSSSVLEYILHCVRIVLPNSWEISLSYDSISACGARFEKNGLDSETVEIAIFTPSGDWYLAEGMEVSPAMKSGFFGWQTAEQLFAIADYISQKEGVPSPGICGLVSVRSSDP